MSEKFNTACFANTFYFLVRVFMSATNTAVDSFAFIEYIKNRTALFAFSLDFFCSTICCLADSRTVFCAYSTRINFKFFSAMSAFSYCLFELFGFASTLQRTVFLQISFIWLNGKINSAMLALFCYSIYLGNICALSIAIHRIRSTLFELKHFIAQWARPTNHGFPDSLLRKYTFTRADLLIRVLLIGKSFTTDSTSLDFWHKKTSCLVNRVLAEGTQLQTRGNANYIRFAPIDKQLCTLSTSNYSIV